mgnify:FL=1
MMYEVSGGTKAQRKVVDSAMSYVVHILKIPNKVNVEIVLGKFISHGVREDSKNSFEIEICKAVNDAEIAYTVFHEMKHVEQLASGRLRHQGFVTFWEGKDMPLIEYHQRPWEIEAFKFEKNADSILTFV